jgi:hypothetical protein
MCCVHCGIFVLIFLQVTSQAREMSPDNFGKFMTDLLNNHICELINSPNVSDKLAAILAIGTKYPLL